MSKFYCHYHANLCAPVQFTHRLVRICHAIDGSSASAAFAGVDSAIQVDRAGDQDTHSGTASSARWMAPYRASLDSAAISEMVRADVCIPASPFRRCADRACLTFETAAKFGGRAHWMRCRVPDLCLPDRRRIDVRPFQRMWRPWERDFDGLTGAADRSAERSMNARPVQR
jgi:hypothetical protein